MAPGPRRKLALPSALLKELDAEGSASYSRGNGNPRHQLSRKDQRKAARVQKRQAQSSQIRRQHPTQSTSFTQTKASPRTHVRKQESDDETDDDDEVDEDGEDEDDELDSDLDHDEDAGSGWEDEDPGRNQLTKSEQKKLAQDDKDIAALEKKLGLRSKRSLPKAFEEDGLGDLLGDLGDEDDDNPGSLAQRKRKAEADEWLAQKRRKAEAAAAKDHQRGKSNSILQEDLPDSEDFSDSDDDGEDGLEDLEDLEGIDDDSDEEQSDGNFEGFSDAEEMSSAPRQRENPYVAPTTGVAKYVPPSLRKQSGSDNEAEAQLRRRVQGLINRLTNDNMIGIIKDFNNLYNTKPRQTVTSTLSDLILALVCSPEKRPDSFFTMMAGFIAAAHKAIGMSVSAYLIQQLVEVFHKHYEAASGDHSDAASKHLIALLAELYNMQVIGCNLVFDFVRLFLGNLSELNTELLLRIIQLSGPSLRREDPHALADIVSRIRPGNTKNMSVRTSFMIDEMKKLQSNKTKAGARNKDLAEQRTQIRKRIGTLGGTQDVQPLRVGLKDIQDADKRGKWWLVGASWSGTKEDGNGDGNKRLKDRDQDDETITQVDDDLGIPDLWQLAREQGFNTEIRQRIFVALHAATDFENADLLIRKLRLNKHQRKEIPEVIVRSGERQSQYNHYYTLVASRFAGDRELGFQFRRCITTRFKKMGEDIDTGDGDDLDDMEEAADYDVRWIYNTAKMYGSLVASKSVKLIDIIKHRNLAALQEKTHMFIEVMFITILQESKSDTLKDVFGGLDEHAGRGVQYFLKKRVRKTDLLKDKKEKKIVKKNCNAAVEILESVLATVSLE
ncbi:hypothetical protein F4810DRAFT_714206 [Camillea tinctor]|nr:hypothetical protein F4810DRAFT_714206 [Camillea tinctor]